MTCEPKSDVTSTGALTLAVPSPSVARPTKTIEIVRAESELLAIDELMADLTNEFVSDLKN
ncbi:MAG: hypothetical protein H6821_12755 [Planctomycetaceae bacterium]|nr:hypothetical protein [Planctomycetales bacterium]MCB9875040.1 hypothetical protein [Planctomycetaceae bacterium]MCB9940095.1 hypothetical protein [Planctomycetaceae bacterium]